MLSEPGLNSVSPWWGSGSLHKRCVGPTTWPPGTSQGSPTVSQQLPTNLAAWRSLSPDLLLAHPSGPACGHTQQQWHRGAAFLQRRVWLTHWDVAIPPSLPASVLRPRQGCVATHTAQAPEHIPRVLRRLQLSSATSLCSQQPSVPKSCWETSTLQSRHLAQGEMSCSLPVPTAMAGILCPVPPNHQHLLPVPCSLSWETKHTPASAGLGCTDTKLCVSVSVHKGVSL